MKLRVEQRYDPNFQESPVVGTSPENDGLSESKVTDYVGNKIYENGELKKILVDGGYYDYDKGEYFFYIQDHLGNNRVVADSEGNIAQRNDYYPFGMEFADNEGNDQPYKYNGKEQDKMHGVNLYDSKKRYYDSEKGRFTSIDPLTELHYDYSPYAYVLNNPMIYIDPNGCDTIYAYSDGTEFDRVKADGPDVTIYGPSADVEKEGYYSQSQQYYNSFGIFNWGVGILASTAQLSSTSTFSLLNSSYQLAPKLYTSGFVSNQYVSTFKVAKVGKMAGRASIGIGVVIDANGVRNYYEDPMSANAVTPAKFGLNLGVTAHSAAFNPVVGIGYFAIDAFFPGGWEGALTAQMEVQDMNREIVPNFRMIPFTGK